MNEIVFTRWEEGCFTFLDQTQLPEQERWVQALDARTVAEAIRSMQIRGAPLIGIAAAFAICLEARKLAARKLTPAEFRQELQEVHKLLLATRPTAVNLAWSLQRMQDVWDEILEDLEQSSPNTALDENESKALVSELVREACAIRDEDAENCRRIGECGADLLAGLADTSRELTLMTYCNTGSLATAQYGTALGVIYLLAERGFRLRVYVPETRPLLQGARLTSWELVRAGIEAVLITDNAIASVLRERKVQAVIAGADRITRTGDVANKIGTYGLAVLAKEHRVPFYIAAPRSSFDLRLEHGAEIPIEERAGEEVTTLWGHRVAPPEVLVYNPAFDVTPASLVTAIFTEYGVLRPPYRESITDLLSEDGESICLNRNRRKSSKGSEKSSR